MKKIMNGFRALRCKSLAVLSALLLLAGAASGFAATAHAAYTYTVTLFSGVQGTFNAGAFNNVLVDSQNIAVSPAAIGAAVTIQDEEVKISGIPAADSYGKPYRVVYNPSMVNVTNPKYLVKGLRESGKDNNVIGTASFDVTRDTDLVVGYYIASNVVAYTVNFVDENNQPIFTVLSDGSKVSTRTHYGNVGVDAVLAFPYIEGYQPKAYSGVMTLGKDASKNVFNFPYTKIVEKDAKNSTPGTNPNEDNPADPGEGNPEGTVNDGAADTVNADPAAENDTRSRENAGSEREAAGQDDTGIAETMDFSAPDADAQEDSDELPESEPETVSNRSSSRILNVLKQPSFIVGALGGTSGLALLVVFLIKIIKRA